MLINNGSIHVAPKQKIVPANEIAQLLEGEEILAKIKEDAKKFRLQVAEEAEKN